MKISKSLSLVLAAILLFVAVSPVQAQLGTSNTSVFTVQNIEATSPASVTITFVEEDGGQVTPPVLRPASGTAPALNNPFNLDAGQSVQINVANVPGLGTGRYSVIIASTARVAAMAAVAGDGPVHFNGSYGGFSEGAQTVYLASSHWNASNWFAMITVQNLGAAAANVEVTINCTNGSVGTLTRNGIPSYASHTFDLKVTAPSWSQPTSSCTGSARVRSTNGQPIAVINNQNVPTMGMTNTIEGYPAGATTLYVPQLQTNFSGWSSALNIRKLASGNTTVTVNYDDSEPNDTCNLTDAAPSCQLYMPSVHPTSGRYGAKVTSSNSIPLIASVGGTSGRNSGSYVGVGTDRGSQNVAIPQINKRYYGYISAINCQNVSATTTRLRLVFTGNIGSPVTINDTTDLSEGESLQIATTAVGGLPNGWRGSVNVTAINSSARIACTVGNTNVTPPNLGDWNNQYNAFPR